MFGISCNPSSLGLLIYMYSKILFIQNSTIASDLSYDQEIEK